jgi:hypothetical protein
MRPGLLAVALLAALVVVAWSGCRDDARDRQSTVARGDAAPISPSATPVPPQKDGCPVTQPNHRIPPGQADNPGASEATYHGNGRLWTALYPQGIVKPPSPRDGSIREKFPWWRAERGRLAITGHRLDGRARPLRARVPAGYGPTGFQSSALIFPSEGCWSATGTAGGASLTFVTLVVAARGS